MAMSMTSAAFDGGATIPKKFTCSGADVSPALAWSGVPSGTKSICLIVHDPDAPVGDWVHWVLYDLPADAAGLPENIEKTEKLANGAMQGVNDFRRVGYGGPCPPPGPAHRYFFKVFALDQKVNLPAKATRAQLERAMEDHILGKAELMGKFGR